MAVLPFRSAGASLPLCCKDLMTFAIVFVALMHTFRDHSSPIADFYPLDFKIDLNGKRQLWQAIVLLSFIDVRK